MKTNCAKAGVFKPAKKSPFLAIFALTVLSACQDSRQNPAAQQTAQSTPPKQTVAASPTPPSLPLPSPTPPPLPTPSPGESPGDPDFYSCSTQDESFALDFYRLVTPFGMRTFVTTAQGQYHVFTKPFCSPTPELFAAAVSYVNPAWMHLKFPMSSSEGPFQGTAYICFNDQFCPGEVQVTCEDRFRDFFVRGCAGESETLTRKEKRQKRRAARKQSALDWIATHGN